MVFLIYKIHRKQTIPTWTNVLDCDSIVYISAKAKSGDKTNNEPAVYMAHNQKSPTQSTAKESILKYLLVPCIPRKHNTPLYHIKNPDRNKETTPFVLM